MTKLDKEIQEGLYDPKKAEHIRCAYCGKDLGRMAYEGQEHWDYYCSKKHALAEKNYDPKRTLIISKDKPIYFKEKGQKAKEWGKELRAKAHEGKKLKGQQKLTSAVSTSKRLSEFAFPEETVYDISSENPRIRDAMDKMLDIFKNGRFDVVARAIFQRGKGARPSDLWSFSNRMLMYVMGTDDARGYKQWQEIGRYVKKGAKAIYILAPLTKKAFKNVKVIDPKTNQETEEKQSYYFIYGFRAVPVFRVEDTEGAPVIEDVIKFDIPYELTGIVSELGLDVKAIPFSSGSYGYYAPSSKKIRVSSPDIEVFLHELSHAVDDKLHGLKGGQRKDQEVIAEFSAATVGHMMGFKMNIGEMINYVQHYSFTELLKQLNRVEKVVNFIIERTSSVSGLPMVIGQTLPMQMYDIKGIADSLRRQGIEPDLIDIAGEYDHTLSHSENLTHIKDMLGLGGRRKQGDYEQMAEQFYKAQTMGTGRLAYASPQERAAAFARMRETGTLRGYDPKKADIYIITDSKGNKHKVAYAEWLKWMKEQRHYDPKKIKIEQDYGGFLVSIPYNVKLIERIKLMDGKWNPRLKMWFVPQIWEGELIDLSRHYDPERKLISFKQAMKEITEVMKANPKLTSSEAETIVWRKHTGKAYDPKRGSKYTALEKAILGVSTDEEVEESHRKRAESTRQSIEADRQRKTIVIEKGKVRDYVRVHKDQNPIKWMVHNAPGWRYIGTLKSNTSGHYIPDSELEIYVESTFDPKPSALPPKRWYEAMVRGIKKSSDVRNPYAIVKNIWNKLSPSKKAEIKARENKGEHFKYDLPLPVDKPTRGTGTVRMVKPFKLAEVQVNLSVADYLTALKSGIFSRMKRQDGTTALVARCKSPVKNVNIFVDKVGGK